MAMSKLQGDDQLKNLNDLTSPKAIKEEYAEIMKPYFNFEQFLIPGPMSICILGKLMLVASKTDIDLSKSPPRDGFKLLQNPESFRACLIQIANDGYEAFNTAHTNMDKIRLQTLQTPGQLTNVLKILLKGSIEDVQDLLPIELRAMKKSAVDCVNYAEEAENSFRKVMKETAELFQSSVSTEGHYEKKLRKTEAQLKSTETQIKGLKSEVEDYEKIQKEMKTAMENAEKDYRQALDKVPGSWDFIGMQCVENISNTFSGVVNALSMALPTKMLSTEGAIVNAFAGFLGKSDSKSKKKQEKGSKEADGKDEKGRQARTPDDEMVTICEFTPKIKYQIQFLTLFVNKEEKRLNTSQFTDETKKKIEYHEEEFKAHKKKLSTYDNDITRSLCSLCDGCAKICSELSSHAGSMNFDEESMKDLACRITDYDTRIVSVASQVDAQTKRAQLQPQSPCLQKTQKKAKASGEKSSKELANENAQMKLTQTSETLKNRRDSYNQACDRVKDTRKQLRDFMAETETLDMKKVEFKDIKEILKKGIGHFSELRKQWSKMARFFQMTSNIIDVVLNNSVQKLGEQVEASQSRRTLAGYSISDLRRDMLYQQTFQVAKVAYLVNMVSTSYVQVSQDHIMTNIAGLGRLIGYRLPDDEDKIKDEMANLTRDFDKVQGIIIKTVEQSKEEFDQTIEDKMKKLAKALPTTSYMKRIQEATKQGMVQAQETPVVPALPASPDSDSEDDFEYLAGN